MATNNRQVIFSLVMANQWKKVAIPPLWDWKVAERIVQCLEWELHER